MGIVDIPKDLAVRRFLCQYIMFGVCSGFAFCQQNNVKPIKEVV